MVPNLSLMLRKNLVVQTEAEDDFLQLQTHGNTNEYRDRHIGCIMAINST